MGRLLLRGGCVLTLGAKTTNHPQADVLIEEDRIVEIGPGLRARDAEVLDASNSIIMPGFVDTHRHTTTALFRNSAAAATSSLSPEDVYAATLIGLLGALESGTTTICDWADDLDRAEPALQAHLDAGVRTVYVSPFKAGGRVDVGELAARSGGRISVAAGSPDVSRDNASKLEGIWSEARTLGLRIHAHAGLDPADAGIVSELGRKGVLGGDVTLVHGTHLSDEDLDTVAARGASLAVAPSSEMAGVLGAPPLQKFLDRNIQPGLAVDDERLSPPDMLAQMRMANSLQHAAYFDLKLAGKAGLPNLLTTRDVIRYATMEGAKTLGLGSVTGSLEAGKQADIVVFRTDKPNIYPINDPIGAVVWGVDRSNVETVIVAGRVRVSEGRVDADIATVRSLVEAAHRRLTPTSGLTGVGT